MPLLRFRPLSGHCKLCHGEVEIRVEGDSSKTIECPKCGQMVEKLPQLSAPPARVAKKPSPSEAKSAGFQVYKRIEKGEYEKQ